MEPSWRPRPGNRVIRRPRQAEISPVHVRTEPRTVSIRGPASPMVLVYGFLSIAAVGAGLLMLPPAHTGDGGAPFLVAIFTAVSAVTVTGLVVVETASYWTGFGQAVLLVLAFVGGIGFMTSAAFVLVLVGRRLSLQNQLAIRENLGLTSLSGLVSLIRRIMLLAVVIQTIGVVVLFLQFYVFGRLWEGISVGSAAWHSLFLGVSAFNNAGLDIVPASLSATGSLSAFKSDEFVLMTVGVLVVLGGIGYLAIFDLLKIWRRPHRLSLETKIVLLGTVVLLTVGAIGVYLLESGDPGQSPGLGTADEVVDSLFNSIVARTAGFAIVDYNNNTDATNVLTSVLMFIGGASASTAGGIKINTFAIILFALFANVRGRRHVAVFNREIPDELATRSLVIGALVTGVLVGVIFALTVTERQPFEDIVFEAVSALGTVGLSKGITPELTDPGRVIVTVSMFVGRFGPLTLALLMAGREAPRNYRLARERVRIG